MNNKIVKGSRFRCLGKEQEWPYKTFPKGTIMVVEERVIQTDYLGVVLRAVGGGGFPEYLDDKMLNDNWEFVK